MVGYADLMEGAAVEQALEAHIQAGCGRFKGVRFSTGADEDSEVRKHIRRPVPRQLLGHPQLREAFAKLSPLGLSFDCWLYFTQLSDVAELARAFPDTSIIVDHVGGVLGLGQYANHREETFAVWKSGIQSIAKQQNISIKLGGLTMKTVGFGFHERPIPSTSSELAQRWRPYIETCIEAFGTDRCMFESNFPVDREGCSYPVLWNAFKLVTKAFSASEKAALYSGTASRIYRI
ncbi:MAG: amidohydrolase family protein [Afipia sp.]|nr:amidohydrolase family protein [Afipia sp.]